MPTTIHKNTKQLLSIPVRNHGNSPAYNVAVNAGIKATFDDIPLNAEDIFDVTNAPASAAMVPPGGNIEFNLEIDLPSDGFTPPCEVRLVATVLVTYTDVFDKGNGVTSCFISNFNIPIMDSKLVNVRWHAHARHSSGRHGISRS